MTRRRREPMSLKREFAIRILALFVILALFYLFLALERFGEWFSQFYTPGR